MVMHRAQLLLEPELYRRLKEIAKQERRSISDVARQLIQEGLDSLESLSDAQIKKELEAIDRLKRLREGQPYYYTGDLVAESREEREKQMDETIWKKSS